MFGKGLTYWILGIYKVALGKHQVLNSETSKLRKICSLNGKDKKHRERENYGGEES